MPLDAISLQAVVAELQGELLGLRIEKVQQPARDQVILLLRGSRRLLLNAGAGAPRLQLTRLQRDNPAEPPMFCMLLRKHLVGGKIAAITQPPLERLVKIELDIIDDFGQPGRRTLVLEAMGRRSNLMLLDGEGRIIDCMRRVDAEMSPQRQVLPGLIMSCLHLPTGWLSRRRQRRGSGRNWLQPILKGLPMPFCWIIISALRPLWPGSLCTGQQGRRIAVSSD